MRQFTYKARGKAIIGGTLLGAGVAAFGILGMVLGWDFSRRRRVLLGPEQAFWLYLAIALVGVFVAVMALLSARAGQRDIMIEPGRLTMPKNERSREAVVLAPYDIQDLNVTRSNNISALVIKHSNGTTKLASSNFDSPQAFDECVRAIEAFRAGMYR